ncbi:unnamed protein product [Sympodiomycopsis kandeliae]
MTLRVRLLTGAYATIFLCTLLTVSTVDAAPSMYGLMQRQVGTAGSNTNGNSETNGGAGSAANAAQAAGNSIDTGSGGNRSTPSTQAAFARLLSGTFFGCLIGLLLGGAFFVQCMTYFDRFGRKGGDAWPLQCLVAMLLVFSLLSDAVLIHRIYAIHVKNFGDFAFPLLTIGWELTVDYICIAFMATGVQLYFAHRVWAAFGRPLYIAIPFGILIGYTFVGGITSGVLSYQAGSTANVSGQALKSFQPDSTPWQCPENFFYLIPFAPIGQVYGGSVVATLMKRTSIARELAQDQIQGPENRNIDAFAQQAPTSIAKPVLKRIMKREEARRPLEVTMTTVVQQVTSTDETYGYRKEGPMNEKTSDDHESFGGSEYQTSEHSRNQATQVPFGGDSNLDRDNTGASSFTRLANGSRSDAEVSEQGAITANLPFELVNGPSQLPGATVLHPFQGASYETARQKSKKLTPGAKTKKANFAIPETVERPPSPSSMHDPHRDSQQSQSHAAGVKLSSILRRNEHAS